MSDERKVWARNKFRVSEVKQMFPDVEEDDQEVIRLTTEYDLDADEDRKFSVATPYGHMEFALTNPKLVGQLKPGQEFYVDLIPVDG